MKTHPLFDIDGKKAIVTGGTRGLGFGMAEGLMEAGCEVVIVGTSDKVYSVADEFCQRGFKCHGVKADLSQRAQVFKCFDDCMAALGGDLDILVTAHGIQRRHRAEVFPENEWDEVIASMVSWFGGQTVPAYTAAKGGVTQLTKELSNDWIARGINVNSIAPGYMATEMNAALLDKNNPRYQQITERIPANRWGTGDDMKGTVIFLASHASDYLNGAEVGETVAVIGGGNSGIEAAIDLAGICSRVTVLEFASELRADTVLQEKARSLSNVEILTSRQTVRVVGDGNKVTAIDVRDLTTGEESTFRLDGVFVQIGLVPASGPFKDSVEVNRRGEIVTDGAGRTSVPGVYAAGDVADVPFKQIVIAMGSGATAALSAFDDRVRGVLPVV